MSFRLWLEQLRSARGSRPLWPVLLGAALDQEFRRQQGRDESYRGNVAICRIDHELADGDREERLVAKLFRTAMAADGCVSLAGEPVLLLGFQWPTQGGTKEKSRRADLVGMTRDGGLVVFEAKKVNGESPIIAITEGLDYLACLMRQRNFERIQEAVQQWIRSGRRSLPTDFAGVRPNSERRPTLVVLAPEAYFTNSRSRGIRFRDWSLFATVSDSLIPSVRLKFAATDFRSVTLWDPPLPART